MLFESIERFPVRYKIVSGQDKAVQLFDLKTRSTQEIPFKFYTHKIQLHSQQLIGCYIILKSNASAFQDDVKVYSIIAPSFVQFFAQKFRYLIKEDDIFIRMPQTPSQQTDCMCLATKSQLAAISEKSIKLQTHELERLKPHVYMFTQDYT